MGFYGKSIVWVRVLENWVSLKLWIGNVVLVVCGWMLKVIVYILIKLSVCW